MMPVIASMIRLSKVIPFAERKPHASHIQTSAKIPTPIIRITFDVFMTICEVNKFY